MLVRMQTKRSPHSLLVRVGNQCKRFSNSENGDWEGSSEEQSSVPRIHILKMSTMVVCGYNLTLGRGYLGLAGLTT